MDKTSPDFLRVLRAERRDLLNRMRQTRFESLREGCSHSQVIPFATYSPWLDDDAFSAIFETVKAFTMVDIYRCYELHRLARQCRHVAGDIVEIGAQRP
jgi:O-methyltransferase